MKKCGNIGRHSLISAKNTHTTAALNEHNIEVLEKNRNKQPHVNSSKYTNLELTYTI